MLPFYKFLSILLLLFAIPGTTCLRAQGVVPHSKQIELSSNLPDGKDPAFKKLSSGLQQVYTDKKTILRQLRTENAKSIKYNSFVFREDRIAVDIIAKDQSKVPELLKELDGLNFEQKATFGKMISGKIPIDQIKQLNDLTHLQYARPVYQPITRVGSVDSQGDTAMYTDLGRATYSLDGTGLKIGALSDSYNTLSGAAAGIASGDLPGPGNPNGYTTPVTTLLEYSSTGSDEARGMIELIHDVAPAAQIYARTAFEGEADFAQGILDLAAAGCDVIVDDIGYFAEPFFQDGIVAQAVDSVVKDGVIYFSSAGNSGRKSYESAGFNDSGFSYGGNPIHDFDPNLTVDYGQQITIPAGVTLQITLQWDDPFGSLPNSVGGADTDLDIHIVNSSFTSILTSSTTNNITSGDPYEIVSYTNSSGSDVAVNIMIVHYAGPAPGFMKYVCWTNNVTIDENDTESSTLVGHPNSSKAIAVGAAAYYNTTAYGATPTGINSFSSAGGTPIFFDSVGNSITTVYRQKPEVVGPDGTNTTFFGTDIAQDGDSHPNFFGTSASAPHVAAAAVLLLELGATTRSEVLAALTNTSEDMEDPATPGSDTGFDYGTGYGMVRINQALAYQAALPVELLQFTVQPIDKNKALLEWSTANELNNQAFILEHAHANGEFSTLATIDGKGNSLTTSYYSYDVAELAPGTHYFRLLQMDFDGSITEQGMRSLYVQGDQHQHWSYRQANGQQQLVVLTNQDTRVDIRVYNAMGKLLLQQEQQILKGERKVTEISAPGWPAGTYFYQILSDNNNSQEIQSGKFLY